MTITRQKVAGGCWQEFFSGELTKSLEKALFVHHSQNGLKQTELYMPVKNDKYLDEEAAKKI